MGAHKYNQTAIDANSGALPPRAKKISASEFKKQIMAQWFKDHMTKKYGSYSK